MSESESDEWVEEVPTMFTIFFADIRQDESYDLIRIRWIFPIPEGPFHYIPPGDVWFTTYLNHGRVLTIILCGRYYPHLDDGNLLN